MRSIHGIRAAIAAVVFGAGSSLSCAGVLNIHFGYADNTERDGFTALVNDFRAGNPDVDVRLTLVDAATHRKSLPTSLDGDAPDVFNWVAGEQMRGFAQHGQLDDIGDLWKANNWTTAYGATAPAATVDGHQVGLPYQYYAWGLFSRRDVLEAAGIRQAPTDLPRLISACSKLRKAGFTPIALGGRDGAAIAAWFDYIDMRTNGYEFHNQVVAGKVSFDDRDMRRTFGMWKQLIDAQCFAPNAAATDTGTATAMLYQGKAAFLLAGTTVSAGMPDAIRPVVDYQRFPVIDSGLPSSEAAPVDTFHIAAHARNKADARRFMKFAGSSAANAKLTKTLGSFPANNIAPVPGTVLNIASYKTLTDAKAQVLQGFLRDAPPEMAQAGVKAFQDFVTQPAKMYPLLTALDTVRAHAYVTTVSQDTPPATKTAKR